MEEQTNNHEIILSSEDFIKLNETTEKIKQEIHKVLVGQDKMIELLLTGLLTGGHVLLEGVPGIAKTLTAKLLAQTLNTKFSRIQFTPDLMPSDVTGTSVFNLKNSEFVFNAGPIFANIVLIDEINRSPAKTQASLFEVMEEKQITVDGTTYPMELPFMVIATQNPIEHEGTYKLPEAQLDRFLFRIKLEYPSLQEEEAILHRFKEDFYVNLKKSIQTVADKDFILQNAQLIQTVFIQDDLVSYIAKIVHETRNHPDLFLGASPRASLSILKSCKALAALRGRNFVTPDDIKDVAYPVLNHRIILTSEKEMEGITSEQVITNIVELIEIPR